jgi:hypothetical protein
LGNTKPSTGRRLRLKMLKWSWETRSRAVAKCVIAESDDAAMDKSIRRMYRDRFPELCDSDRDFEIFESVVRMGRGEEQRQTTRKLVKIKIDGTDGNLWEQVTKSRNGGRRHRAGGDAQAKVHRCPKDEEAGAGRF